MMSADDNTFKREEIRTLFVTQWFEPEPGANRGLPLASWLAKRGHQIEVLTGVPNYPKGEIYPGYTIRFRQREVLNGIRVLRVPLYPSHDYTILGRMLNYGSFGLAAATIGAVSTGPADVAFVYHPPPTVGLAALVLKKLRRIPFVYHISDMWPESVVESGAVGSGMRRKIVENSIHAWCNLIYKAASAITVLSPGFKKLLIQRGVSEEKIHVILNWADESVFAPVRRDEALARELGFSGRFNVMYAGNIGAYQNLQTVVEAASLLKDVPGLQIVIAGTGSEEAVVKSLASQRALSNILFLDPRPHQEMGAINALADVLLVHLRDLPVFRSTTPGKMAVALACGRPLIAGVRGDTADIVEQAAAGMVVPPENPRAMADAIHTFYKMDSSTREQMGANGRQYYLREMSLDIGGQRMDQLLREVARANPKRPSSNMLPTKRTSL